MVIWRENRSQSVADAITLTWQKVLNPETNFNSIQVGDCVDWEQEWRIYIFPSFPDCSTDLGIKMW